MSSIHIIVISSVRPEPTSAGQIILHRHLVDQPGITWEIFGAEPLRLTASSALRRIMGRLGQTRWHRIVHDFWAWSDGAWLDQLLPTVISDPARTVVLTVAQGDACGAARRFARKHRLPLVTIFHDWWPDMVAIHPPFKRLLEKNFRELYKDSQLALCVSEKMRGLLGSHPNAEVLYPIAAKTNPRPRTQNVNFRVMYFGTLHEYGPMMGRALKELKGHSRIRLEARGGSPPWPFELLQELKREGLWLDYAPRSELNDWLASADAFLVPMVFEHAMYRRMETSFPSKIPEMVQFEKPLVIWGPEYCSAIQWGRLGNRALCVTDPDPRALLRTLESLSNSAEEQERLANATRNAAQVDFNPDRIQSQFMDALRGVIDVKPE